MMSSQNHTSSKLRAKNPLWLRATHAINAIAWMIMTGSGWMIYWANDAYTPFLKPGFYKAVGLDHKLALGLALHFSFMWIFIGCGLVYVTRLITSGAWREIVPRAGDWRMIPRVALAELGKGEMPPSHGKLNPAQRCVYFAVLLIAAFEVVCGFAIYKPFQLHTLQDILGGYELARTLHFIAMALLLGFFFVHVAQVIRAGARDFFAIVIAATPEMPLSMQLRRSLVTLVSFALIVALSVAWLRTRDNEGGVAWPLRAVLNLNGWLAKNLMQVDRSETIATSLEASIGGTQPRVNGLIGLENELSEEDELLEIRVAPASSPRVSSKDVSKPTAADSSESDSSDGTAADNSQTAITISLEQLAELKQTATNARFRCIEGWSRPISYKGVRFKDLMLATGVGTKNGQKFKASTALEDLYPYVGFETSDGKYYVSIDIASLLNDQSVLATEMNGEALTFENGAPLRLVIPSKYGIKNIKRIKRITFSETRPHDYWEERGYDWFAGL